MIAAAASPATAPKARPGLWREAGSPHVLLVLDTAAVTPGMVVVARAHEHWQGRAELRYQVWPEGLVAAVDCGGGW